MISHHVCLHREFQQERVKEGKAINKEIDTEWEKQLKELTERYEKDMEKKKKKMKDSEKKVNCFQACFVISVNCCAVFYVSLQKKKIVSGVTFLYVKKCCVSYHILVCYHFCLQLGHCLVHLFLFCFFHLCNQFIPCKRT